MSNTIEEKKPLYKKLNEERSQGKWNVQNDEHWAQIFTDTKFSICQIRKMYRPHSISEANVKYIALAVNNLYVLAEALEKLHNVVMQSNDKTIFDNGKNAEIVAKAKEALNRIS